MISKEEAAQRFNELMQEIVWQIVAQPKVIVVEGVEFRVTPQLDLQPIPGWQPSDPQQHRNGAEQPVKQKEKND